VDGLLEGRCEKFAAGACVQATHWHRGLLHGDSDVYSNGSVVEKTVYLNGRVVIADFDAKTEDCTSRIDAVRDMRFAELQMATWEVECRARAAAAAAAASTVDAKRMADSVVSELLRTASIQSEEATAASIAEAAAAVAAAAAAAEVAEAVEGDSDPAEAILAAASFADACDSARLTAVALVEEIIGSAAAAAEVAYDE
jgi:hypothetical protein